jgi:predicted metal-binding membrane protein
METAGTHVDPLAPVGTASRRGPQRRWWSGSPLMLTVIAGAWMLAVVAELTGQGSRLHHHALFEGTIPAWFTLALFLLTWQVHVAAMMLPSSLPLIGLFNRAAAGQPRAGVARSAFIGGYLAVWTIFGVVALLGDAVIHEVVHRWAWLGDRPQLITGSVLVVAGAFQFSTLKDRCLRECRHPAAFLLSHYQRGAGAAFALGRRHGVFCVGCCWALMLVMFAVGITNLAWMAPLALVMVAEKAAPAGPRLVAPVGVALIVLGVLVLLDPAWLPSLFATDTH